MIEATEFKPTLSNSRGMSDGDLILGLGVLPRVLAMAASCVFLLGCPADAQDVRPPPGEFYFPTGLAATADESAVFVINANADLKHSSGSIDVIDTDSVLAMVDGWTGDGTIPEGCEQDVDLSFLINCDEELVTLVESSVRLASFATDLDIQALDSGGSRLFIASRGDPSVTFADYDPSSKMLSCGGSGRQPLCDDEHRLTFLRDDPDVGRIIEEPFGVYVDGVNEYVAVTHLTSGSVTLLDAPSSGSLPVISDVITGIFAADPSTGARGAVGVAGRRPGTEDDLVYVTSRTESRIQLFSVARPANDGLPRIATSDFFFLEQVRPADDSREIAFGDGGDRAYIVNREPPLLHIVDTSMGPAGVPNNRFVGGVELCSEPANLTVMDVGRGERVYISCFRDSEIWVIDPVGGVVEAAIGVGRGPNSLIGLPGRNKVLVTNFLEDTIAVIEVEPGSLFENRFVMRVGRTRQSEGS